MPYRYSRIGRFVREDVGDDELSDNIIEAGQEVQSHIVDAILQGYSEVEIIVRTKGRKRRLGRKSVLSDDDIQRCFLASMYCGLASRNPWKCALASPSEKPCSYRGRCRRLVEE